MRKPAQGGLGVVVRDSPMGRSLTPRVGALGYFVFMDNQNHSNNQAPRQGRLSVFRRKGVLVALVLALLVAGLVMFAPW